MGEISIAESETGWPPAYYWAVSRFRLRLAQFRDAITRIGRGLPTVRSHLWFFLARMNFSLPASQSSLRRLPLHLLDVVADEAASVYETRLVLVRPDQHVAWRGDAPPPDPLSLIDRVRGAQTPPTQSN
jgi:hypothetical protein